MRSYVFGVKLFSHEEFANGWKPLMPVIKIKEVVIRKNWIPNTNQSFR